MTLYLLGYGFLAMTPKVQAMKEKVDKLDCMRMKNLYIREYYQENEKDSLQNGRKSTHMLSVMGPSPEYLKNS